MIGCFNIFSNFIFIIVVSSMNDKFIAMPIFLYPIVFVDIING